MGLGFGSVWMLGGGRYSGDEDRNSSEDSRRWSSRRGIASIENGLRCVGVHSGASA